MAATASHRDPRSVITPDAFEVSGDLMGTPLAVPMRRLLALMIDGLVIGLITLVTKSFSLILGVVAALFFMRVGFKRTAVRGNVFGRAMRGSVGCLGLLIALITAALWSSFGVDFGAGGGDAPFSASVQASGAAGQVLSALATAGARDLFDDAESIEGAEAAARRFIEGADQLGMDPDEVRSTLLAVVPLDAPWAEEAATLFDRLLPRVGVPIPSAGITEEISSYTTAELLDEYARVLASDLADEGTSARRVALEATLAGIVAGDTLAALGATLAAVQGEVEEQRRSLERATAELATATDGGLFDWFRDMLDELGFGFGWAALYMTVFLSWWNGQTIGKKLMGIRVVRLDGEPITWWVAFERAGGYAAGLATGLLGFAQIWWDSNRQAIHDRIVGTVVIVEGAAKVQDWDSAL